MLNINKQLIGIEVKPFRLEPELRGDHMGDTSNRINPWEMVQAQIDKAVKHIDCDPSMIEKLRYPERSLLVSVPVRMDDGRLKVFKGYRVQHSTVRG